MNCYGTRRQPCRPFQLQVCSCASASLQWAFYGEAVCRLDEDAFTQEVPPVPVVLVLGVLSWQCLCHRRPPAPPSPRHAFRFAPRRVVRGIEASASLPCRSASSPTSRSLGSTQFARVWIGGLVAAEDGKVWNGRRYQLRPL